MPRSPGLEPPGEGGGAAERLRQFQQSRGLQPSEPEEGQPDEGEPDEGEPDASPDGDQQSAQQSRTAQGDRQDLGRPDREDGDA